jgi:hypothetical protein
MPAIVACVLASCGVGSPRRPNSSTVGHTLSSTPGAVATTAHYISNSAITKEPAGSPQRQVLQFWQDIQYQDFPNALAALSPSFVSGYARNLKHFALYVSADQLRWMVVPRIARTTITSPGKATVLVDFLFGGIETPTLFDLQQINGTWLISYNFYLVNRLTAAPSSGKP